MNEKQTPGQLEPEQNMDLIEVVCYCFLFDKCMILGIAFGRRLAPSAVHLRFRFETSHCYVTSHQCYTDVCCAVPRFNSSPPGPFQPIMAPNLT